MNSLVRQNLDLLKSAANSRRMSEETKRVIASRTYIAKQHVALYRKFTFSAYCQNMADCIQAELDEIMKG